jgi:hypothetical protein
MDTSPDVWAVLDEGCNSTVHGAEWMAKAEAKFMKLGLDVEFVNTNKKKFSGIGNATIAYGKRAIHFCMALDDDFPIVGVLHSHEIDGKTPLLLSNKYQASLGLIKDMRDGICMLKDYPGRKLPLAQAVGSGLLIVNISEFRVMESENHYLDCLLSHYVPYALREIPTYYDDSEVAYMGKTIHYEFERTGLAIGFDTFEDKRMAQDHILNHYVRKVHQRDSSKLDMSKRADHDAVCQTLHFHLPS